ncbi:Asp/Glu/hydantoin racemase [Albimonas donghaensis]|uniref:Asp/Glu/hydantoin racemase n=1 Tax=Albimonas donghaensis TaxID=356660 RepID=A0A1H2U259_9RHOB|nr:aspartate/glutamate racemase family protein [Albimonas donghaensis]SDW50295.1 Asp/Glu/hydantoin racemase [Albimonas donghaensis]
MTPSPSVPGPILLVNPNSNEAVTEGMRDAVAALAFPGAPALDCLTLAEGPFGVQTQVESDQVVIPLANLVKSRPDASGFVICCYSDPGIDACRSVAACPVFGIQECGVLAAMARADRFGVIAIAEPSVRRHRLYMRRMGVLDRLAGEIPLNMTVAESHSGEGTFARLEEVGGQLIAQGSEAIVLGCAGMARHRKGLEDRLGVPVIDPVQAAAAMALTTAMLRAAA